MIDLEQKEERDLPDLQRWSEQLLGLTQPIPKQLPLPTQDHFAFMAVSFLSKQIDHMESILKLIPRRDVALIARAMVEGLCQLLWVTHDPDVRALQWRAFGYVLDWRAMQAQIAAGRLVDQMEHEEIEAGLRQYKHLFLTSKAVKALTKGVPTPRDPYHPYWHGQNVRSLCEEIRGEELYQRVYRLFSNWMHWSPAGFMMAMDVQATKTTFITMSFADSATALKAGMQCLYQTAEIVEERLKLGFKDALTQWLEGYLARGQRPATP